MKISFCTTCKGRLSDLSETLPFNLGVVKDLDCEFTLINYNSQDGLDEWVKNNYQNLLDSGYLKYQHVTDKEFFNMAEAKNMAHQLATGDILVNLDADNFLTDDFINLILTTYNKKNNLDFIMFNGESSGYGGRVVLSKKTFQKIGGYDESDNTYGAEHITLVKKCLDLGLEGVIIPSEIMPFLDQPDVMRFMYYDRRVKNIKYLKPSKLKQLNAIKYKRIKNG